jgi:hypothetical protein
MHRSATRVDHPLAFYLILNVAVGGTNGFFPDNVGDKPWLDSSTTAMSDFWAAKDGPHQARYGSSLGEDVAEMLERPEVGAGCMHVTPVQHVCSSCETCSYCMTRNSPIGVEQGWVRCGVFHRAKTSLSFQHGSGVAGRPG